MLRKPFAPLAAALAILMLAVSATPSLADYSNGNIYSYGGVQLQNGSLLSVYVSGVKFRDTTVRGNIAISGIAGRVSCTITKITFATDKKSAVAEGNLLFNGVPAKATVQVATGGRGIIGWTVTDAAGGVLWSSGAPLTLVSGQTLIYSVY
jgi:hypothetical protein